MDRGPDAERQKGKMMMTMMKKKDDVSSLDIVAVNSELKGIHEEALFDQICDNILAFLWKGFEEDHENLTLRDLSTTKPVCLSLNRCVRCYSSMCRQCCVTRENVLSLTIMLCYSTQCNRLL